MRVKNRIRRRRGERERRGQWLRGVRKRNFLYMANVLSNARAARDRMVRGAAG